MSWASSGEIGLSFACELSVMRLCILARRSPRSSFVGGGVSGPMSDNLGVGCRLPDDSAGTFLVAIFCMLSVDLLICLVAIFCMSVGLFSCLVAIFCISADLFSCLVSIFCMSVGLLICLRISRLFAFNFQGSVVGCSGLRGIA